MGRNQTALKATLLAACTVTFVLALPVASAELNPTAYYFMYGKLIGERNIHIGDPDNWDVALDGLNGTTDSGKLTVRPGDYLGEDKALFGTWSKQKVKGQVAIYGPTINLAAYEDTSALVFEVNVMRPSNKPVMLGMDCHYPCRSEFDIRRELKRYPKNEWATFAVPLNCFTLNEDAGDFDISRINGPFLLSTEGRMEIAIANIRLALLPEGDPGCR